MNMIRPPLPLDRTPEDALLAGIGNAWRRELLRYCAAPRSRREIEREYPLVSYTQIRPTLDALVEAGWLRLRGGAYHLNLVAALRVEHCAALACFDWLTIGESRDSEIDLAVAALRRQSCRDVLAALDNGYERSTLELIELTGYTRKQVYHACRAWTRLGLLDETPETGKRGNRYRRINAPVLAALGGYLYSLHQAVGNENEVAA
jgi:Fe2+ or Zn2+ uptake regulation protein